MEKSKLVKVLVQMFDKLWLLFPLWESKWKK